MSDPEVTDKPKEQKMKVESESSKTPPGSCSVSQQKQNETAINMSDVDIDNFDELLDSALADFGKPQPAAAKPQSHATTKTIAGEQKTSVNKTPTPSQEEMFAKIFDEAEVASAADAMKSFQAENPELLQQLNSLLSQSAGEETQEDEDDDKFMESLRETMKAMSDNVTNLQTEDLGDDDLVKALNDLGLNMGDVSDDNFDPLIQNMMKNLLSKDVLYPSMHRIDEVYPGWLESNRATLSETQYRTYEKQHALIAEICQQFESEQESDTADTRSRRFDHIYGLMQQMQDCGQPPPDIVKHLSPGLSLDASGMPRLAGMEDQCTVM